MTGASSPHYLDVVCCKITQLYSKMYGAMEMPLPHFVHFFHILQKLTKKRTAILFSENYEYLLISS